MVVRSNRELKYQWLSPIRSPNIFLLQIQHLVPKLSLHLCTINFLSDKVKTIMELNLMPKQLLRDRCVHQILQHHLCQY